MDFALLVDQWELVVGEKISRGINKKTTFIMISKSGGARMMEAAYSLMQLAKTSVTCPAEVARKTQVTKTPDNLSR
jgi:acetyl-CoA carboxylase carboxyl transferase subunit beta